LSAKGANSFIMNITEQKAFIKANKQFLAAKPTNVTINQGTPEELQALVDEITKHENYVPAKIDTPSAVNATKEFGELLELPYIGRSRNGFKFQHGDAMVYCNDARLFAIESSLIEGQVFPFKADSLESLKYGGFSARLNYSASEIITSVNAELDAQQAAMTKEIKKRSLLLGISIEAATAQVHALFTADMDKQFTASMPKVKLFG